MPIISYNGSFQELGAAGGSPSLLQHNRAFRLGDGLFETLRIMGGRVLFAAQHWQRLQRGVQLLGLELPQAFNEAECVRQLNELIQANKIYAGGKIRITVFRTGGEGAYLPVRNEAGYLMEASAILYNTYPTDRTQRLVVYADWRVHPHPLSGFKTTSALQYVMAARFAQAHGADDALLLDAAGNIVETSKANIFIVRDNLLITPPLDCGCLDGVLRAQVVELANENQIPAAMQDVSPQMLYDADAVFTTNVVSGIIPVHYLAGSEPIRAKSYDATNAVVRKLQQLLARHVMAPKNTQT